MASRETESLTSYPHRTDIYTYRVPTPPRIVVPPPALNANAVPEITLQALNDPPDSFLRTVDYANLVQGNAAMDWAYERRREAQRILPFLYLGPMMAAKDEAWLRGEGITMLLGIRQKHSFESRLMNSAAAVAARLGVEHQAVDLAASNQALIQAFPDTTRRIAAHLARVHRDSHGARFGKVLVFCESGNERSAGVVAAYLMETHADVDYIKAMQLCQAQRFCVNFDDGMKRLLQGYWDILCAQRAVASQGGSRNAEVQSTSRTKRALEQDDPNVDDHGMEVDTADQDDVERFAGRQFAPFVDQPL